MRNRVPLLGAALLAAFLLSGCAGGTNVKATDDAFVPNVLTLKVGDEVKVTNAGDKLHSVTIHKAGDPVSTILKDTDMQSGTGTSFKLGAAGTYHVFCKYHSSGGSGNFGSGMVMTVTVT